MTNTQATFARIAKEHLQIETLKTRKHDSLDFHTVAVWEVHSALQAAYEAGRSAPAPGNAPGNAPGTATPGIPGNESLPEVIREQLSPEAVAAIAAWLQPASTNNPEVDRQIQWFVDQLVEMLGTDQYNALCNELGL